MSRLEAPLLRKLVWATGDILLRAELDLLIKDNGGAWQTETFRVDSGTEMTTMPAALAKSLDLPMPRNPVPGGLDLMGKRREVRVGLIRAQVVGMDPTEYVFPCYFIGDPDAPFDPQNPPRFPRKLLGLTGVVDQIRILFDGTPTATAPHGLMTVEKI
jgi:hypothetical protein